jgi:hypothetical protein
MKSPHCLVTRVRVNSEIRLIILHLKFLGSVRKYSDSQKMSRSYRNTERHIPSLLLNQPHFCKLSVGEDVSRTHTFGLLNSLISKSKSGAGLANCTACS